MRYIVSDIHGCYAEYRALLEKIRFSGDDTLYVLGDAMDRGPEPIRVIRDLMDRPNVYYILGNHDDMMLQVMEVLAQDVQEKALTRLTPQFMEGYNHWLREGGAVTAEQFRKLSREERLDILDYLRDAPGYELAEEGDHLFVMVHGGLGNFHPDRELDDYSLPELIWERPDYTRQYFPGSRITLVTGHTPTPLIREDRQPLVYKAQGHLALDCGCVFGGALAAYCLETDQVTYV